MKREKLYGVEQVVTLKDGTAVYIRPIRKEDFNSLLKFYFSLSPETLTFRFFSKPSKYIIEEYVKNAVNIDYKKSFGIVAIYGDKIIGHAEYRATSENVAEVAFVVSDEYQGKGVATIMLGVLAEAAERNGIKIFEGIVNPENYRMIKVFEDSGFPVKIKIGCGEIRVTMPTAITEDVLEYFERREKIAVINALRRFFYPRSIAVIGASRDRESVGGKTFYNLLNFGFNGVVYPVNKNAKHVQGVKSYPSVLDIPDEIDLAIISVPYNYVLEVAEECGKKGVKALIVLTSGFAEVGEEGRKRQEELLKICRKYGMRLIGPNCMGIVNTDPNIRLNATFAPNPPIDGRIGFASQSGAVGLAVMDRANLYGLGLSAFVSLGNRADISSNDLLEYWEDDDRTDLIMLYLESFGNPRRFTRLARRISKKKPILALASGVTPAGAKAVSSHTGEIIYSSGIAVDALFKQAGIIRASSLDELYSIASFVLHQPLPRGRRVCIITNGGGLGAITSDWCQDLGLEVPDLSSETQETLRKILPPIASVRNPVDMTAEAKAEDYYATIKTVAEDDGIDSLIVIFVQAISSQKAEDVKEKVLSATKYANKLGKPVMFIYLSSDSKDGVLSDGEVSIPVYVFPNISAKVLSKVVEYAEWKRKPKESLPVFDVDRDRAAAIIAKSLGRREWMKVDDTFEVLKCYGISVAEYRFVTLEDVYKVSKEIGNRLILKAVASGSVCDVRANISPEESVKIAEEIAKRHKVDGFIVQKMVDGVEMFIGVTEDPNFGPLITCGIGGVFMEIFKDTSVRLTPVTKSEAYEMVQNLKSYKLLLREKADVDSLVETILRISSLIEDFPEIVEIECSPVVVHKEGCDVLDAKIRLRKTC